MSFVLFDLTGEMALWRNVHESMGAFSCLGPAPGNLAGLAGAALGFASPRSAAATGTDDKKLAQLTKKGLPWPLSPELLTWEEANDLHIACRWTGSFPRRGAWNVNGCKEIGKGENLRMQQQVIFNPSYQVAFQLPEAEAEKLAAALKQPAFPLYLGASFCRAVIRNVTIAETLPESPMWAFHTSGAAFGEATPFTRHVVNAEQTFERVKTDGYWVYPTPDQPGLKEAPTLVRAWTRWEDITE